MLSELQDLKHPIPTWLRDVMVQPRTGGDLLVEDCPIHYLSWGNPANRALVFLHGRMSHSRCWAFIAPFLATEYHCVAIDSSGMGDSGHRDQYSRATRATEVKAIADHLELFDRSENPLLVSHSYGAVIGVDVLNKYPSTFGGIIACDPSLHHPKEWASLLPRQDGAGLTRPHRTHADLTSAISRFKFAPTQVSKHPVLEEYIARHSLKETEGGWCWKFDPLVYSASEEGHDNWWLQHTQDLVNLQIPRAIIYGDRSELVSKDTVDAVQERSSDAIQKYEISDAAHHLMVDQPFALVETIRKAILALPKPIT